MTISDADHRETNRIFIIDGRKQSLRSWCRELDIPYGRAYSRILAGWEAADVLDPKYYGRTHGASQTPEYMVWKNMKGRCNNPKNSVYKHYGKRGITVCARWLTSFENFIIDMGARPSALHQLDRIDVNGSYSPENCRWAAPTQNARNKRNNRLISYNGETLPLSAWAERTGIAYNTLRMRLEAGWEPERALTEKLARKLS